MAIGNVFIEREATDPMVRCGRFGTPTDHAIDHNATECRSPLKYHGVAHKCVGKWQFGKGLLYSCLYCPNLNFSPQSSRPPTQHHTKMVRCSPSLYYSGTHLTCHPAFPEDFPHQAHFGQGRQTKQVGKTGYEKMKRTDDGNYRPIPQWFRLKTDTKIQVRRIL